MRRVADYTNGDQGRGHTPAACALARRLVVLVRLDADPSSSTRVRTWNRAVNSRMLYQLSYEGMAYPAGLEPATSRFGDDRSGH